MGLEEHMQPYQRAMGYDNIDKLGNREYQLFHYLNDYTHSRSITLITDITYSFQNLARKGIKTSGAVIQLLTKARY